MVSWIRSWSKLMGRSTILRSLFAAWKAKRQGAIARIITLIIATAAVATLAGCHRQPEKSAELWLGGDVNLGDGGKGQLQGITGMVQGAAGIVNLEGPVSGPLPNKKELRLWNSPAALNELAAVQIKVTGIANNHANDAGAGAPEQTAKIL